MPWGTYQGAGKTDQVAYFNANVVQFQNLNK